MPVRELGLSGTLAPAVASRVLCARGLRDNSGSLQRPQALRGDLETVGCSRAGELVHRRAGSPGEGCQENTRGARRSGTAREQHGGAAGGEDKTVGVNQAGVWAQMVPAVCVKHEGFDSPAPAYALIVVAVSGVRTRACQTAWEAA